MKHVRILSLSLVLVLMLGLFTACGKSGAGSESGSDAQSSASTPQSGADASQPESGTPDVSAPGQDNTSTPDAEAPAALTLNKKDFSLFKAGATYKLTASGAPDGTELVWASSNNAVATVDETGTVTGVGAGSAVITATAGELTASCTVRCKIEADKPVSGTPSEDELAPAPIAPSTPEQSKPEEKPQTPAKVDLAAFYETIFTDPANSPYMEAFPAEGLDAFYPGLTTCELNQRVAYMAGMSAVACEIVMVECTNASDVNNVKAIFQARIDSQVNNHFNYPMVIEAWEKEAKIVSNGNYVALFVVSGMTDQVVSNFNALF